jgi:hypothetical protein
VPSLLIAQQLIELTILINFGLFIILIFLGWKIFSYFDIDALFFHNFFPGAALRRESRQEQRLDDKIAISNNNNNNSVSQDNQEQMSEVERNLRSRLAKRDGLMRSTTNFLRD